MDYQALTQTIRRLALEAGDLIMDIYNSDDFDVKVKSDDSPVTAADEAADAHISKGLRAAFPDVVLVTEEQSASHSQNAQTFLIVDPLDGTKEFINKRGEFTVNIGIIENGVPVMGVVYAPALKRLFVADTRFSAWQATAAPGGVLPGEAERQKLSIRPAPEAGLTAIASKSHRSDETNTFLESQPVADIISAGSSLKFCLIAAGEADLYPRLGRTMEWDTAAGQAVAEAAGARVTEADGRPLLYGKEARGYDNPHFIVWGDVTPPVPA